MWMQVDPFRTENKEVDSEETNRAETSLAGFVDVLAFHRTNIDFDAIVSVVATAGWEG
jgi:hypothetical protein